MDQSPIDTFLREATEGSFDRAAAILRDNPSFSTANFLAACVTGELATVRQHPDLAAKPAGPLNAEPILYTAYSQFLRHDPTRAPDILEVAKFLLAHGANPNAFHPYGEWKLTALYAASGRANNPALTKLLLDAGANPNDNESLYHSTEFGDPRCTRLLLQHGAKIPGSNAVHRQLDFEDPAGLQLFFEFGADPNLGDHNGNPILHHAIDRGRSPQILAIIADHGADLRRKGHHGLTPYKFAALLGHLEALKFLEQRGAAEPLTPEEKFIAACASGNAEHARQHKVPLNPPYTLALPALAWRHNTKAVTLLLENGAPADATGIHGETALHNAAWMGNLEMANQILNHNPPLETRDRSFKATPLGWAIHGHHNSKTPTGHPLYPNSNHKEVLRALLAAGATINPQDREALDKFLQ